MSSVHSLSFEKYIQAPASEVYHALTNSTRLREWMCDIATTEPKLNGRIYTAWFSGFYGGGHFTQLEKDRKVAFTWYGRGEPRATLVTFTLKPQGEGTLVELTHSEIGEGEEWEQTKRNFVRAWESGLGNLASALETGIDLRIVRQPMLGIRLEHFNAEVAQKLGIPVTEGVRLSGVIDGMGAQAAGLQADDVLVRIGGIETKDFNTLSSIISRFQAGDEVEVEFYRGAEKKTAVLKLSSRSLPKIPAQPIELAKQVKKQYNRFLRELSETFKGVSDAEASFKVSPDEWSAKETLAHLIQSERAWHQFIQDMVGSYEPIYDDGGNLPARISATAAVFPTVRELLAEFKTLTRETVALISFIPESFTQRKSSYWRLGFNAMDVFTHLNSHLDQIKAAIQASRR